MDGVSPDMVAQSVEAVCQVMKAAQAQYIELAEKMIKVTTEIAVGIETGKGKLLDIIA